MRCCVACVTVLLFPSRFYQDSGQLTACFVLFTSWYCIVSIPVRCWLLSLTQTLKTREEKKNRLNCKSRWHGSHSVSKPCRDKYLGKFSYFQWLLELSLLLILCKSAMAVEVGQSQCDSRVCGDTRDQRLIPNWSRILLYCSESSGFVSMNRKYYMNKGWETEKDRVHVDML